MKNSICYLCGKVIEENPSRDHVPPAQFFCLNALKKIKMQNKPNLNKLITLPTHKNCNQSYSEDETYFFETLGFIAIDDGTNIAEPMIERQMKIRFHNHLPAKQRFENYTKGFSPKVGNLYIPGASGWELDMNKLFRVSWKILRGLFFSEKGQYLPENIQKAEFIIEPHAIRMKMPKLKILDLIRPFLQAQKKRGTYKRFFYYQFDKDDEHNLEYWVLVFWDRIMFIHTFFYPNRCTCESCENLFK